MHSVKITPDGVWIDGERIARVRKVLVYGAPNDGIEVELTLRAVNVDVAATKIDREECAPQIETTSLSEWKRPED